MRRAARALAALASQDVLLVREASSAIGTQQYARALHLLAQRQPSAALVDVVEQHVTPPVGSRQSLGGAAYGFSRGVAVVSQVQSGNGDQEASKRKKRRNPETARCVLYR